MRNRTAIPFSTMRERLIILDIPETDRFQTELLKEHWRRPSTPDGCWHGPNRNRLWLSQAGFHAYIGLEQDCPPLDDIDILEPVASAPILPPDDTSTRSMRRILADRAFDEYRHPPRVPVRVHAYDVDRMRSSLRRFETTAFEMRRWDTDPKRWNRLVDEWRQGALLVENGHGESSQELSRLVQAVAIIIAGADLGQFILALPTGSAIATAFASITFAAACIFAILVYRQWRL